MKLQNIETIAKKINISKSDLELYGSYKAKIKTTLNEKIKGNKEGKLVLVTAITPTKAGEGKTTASIALLDGLAKINQKALLCLREPSMGPVFGLKGGATGGGKVTVEPHEDINLHFTGDMHALTSSINLISSIIDNHIFQGNELNIDPSKVVWKRALDLNDRALREVTICGGKNNGVERVDHFQITVASELMAVLCIASDEKDFIRRLNKILVAYTFDNKPIYLEQLHITNAIMKIMQQALLPNIVQTAEHNPVLVHGGPFANIAHGCSSLMATKLALKLSPIVITEAGFGADLGAEKFLDIKCNYGGLKPDACVLVATIRALKLHGGQVFEELENENLEALKLGLSNLKQHYENMSKFGLPIVVAINHFKSDSKDEIKLLKDFCLENKMEVAFMDGFLKGGNGSKELAQKVLDTLNTKKSKYKRIYNNDDSIETKIETIAKEIYRADSVIYTDKAKEDIAKIKKLDTSKYVVCMAKTPMSFSDNPKLLNTPKNFSVTVKEVTLSNGAEFIVCLLGSVLTMPGLPKVPNACKM